MGDLYANNYTGQLAQGCTAITTTLHVLAAAPVALRGGQFRVAIGAELLLVTAGQDTTTWTVTRAIEGTSAAVHPSGAAVTHVLTAAGLLGATGVFDVRAYGAVGDGVADDAAAIQAACAAAGTVAGMVTFAPGVYAVGTYITIASPVVIDGGAGATIKQKSASNSAAILYLAAGASGSVVRSLSIDGNAVGQTGGLGRGILSVDATTLRIEHVNISDTVGAGILLENTSPGASGHVISDCRIERAGVRGIELQKVGGVDISDCSVSDTVTGEAILAVAYGAGLRVRNVTASGGPARGIIVDDGTDLEISGCVVADFPDDGISCSNTTRGVISGNRVIGRTPHIGPGISPWDGSVYVSVIGNTVTACAVGIIVASPAASCTDIIISGNAVSGCATGITLDASTGSVVERVGVYDNIVAVNTTGLSFAGYTDDVYARGNVMSSNGANVSNTAISPAHIVIASNPGNNDGVW